MITRNIKIHDDELIKLHNEGLLNREIAERLGCNVSTVTIRLNKLGIRKYKKELQPKMIELYKQGYYDREIAEIVGCTRENVTHYLNKCGYTNRRSKIDDLGLRKRISNSLIGRYVGENNPNYKGYYRDEKKIARGIFKTLSKRMMREYNYTCQHCGKRGGNICVHHIKPFNEIFNEFVETKYSGNKKTLYEELMEYNGFIDETNLVVLCENCHRKVHYSDDCELSPYRWESATTIEKAY